PPTPWRTAPPRRSSPRRDGGRAGSPGGHVAGGERGGEDRVHLPSRGARGPRRVIGSPDLAEDLGFSQDLRIEARGYGEHVAHGLGPVEAFDRARQNDAAPTCQVPEPGLMVVGPAP